MAASKGRPPIGVHIAMLESAGHASAAQALRDLGLRTGEDVSAAAAQMSPSPDQRCREYEMLFERGAINSRMIAGYAAGLIEFGRSEEAARIFDTPRLFQTVMLDDVTVATEPLAQAVAAEIASRAAAEPAANGPVFGMLRVGRLTHDPGPALARMLDVVEAEAQRHLANWADSDHPFARHVSNQHVIHSWCHISQGPGRIDRHYHKRGWVTCVYYPVGVPDGEKGGDLVIGSPDDGEPLPGWPQARIRPRAGLLVLMPSYYTHWTMPYDAPGLRVSIAIDFELTRSVATSQAAA